MFLISAAKHRGRLETDWIVILKGEKMGWGKTCIILGKMKGFRPEVNHVFCWPLRKGKASRFFFFLQAAFIFCYSFYLYNSVTFSFFFFFGSLFVCFSYFSSSLHVGSENSEERQATYVGFLGQQPLPPSHLPSPLYAPPWPLQNASPGGPESASSKQPS